MELIFELLDNGQVASGQEMRKTFKQAGGVIGRGKNCEWVIVDSERYTSGTHAQVTFRDGDFYLTDLSTNGTLIAGNGQTLRKNETLRIEHDAVYGLGKFEIRARLIKDPAEFVGCVEQAVTTGNLIPDEAFLELDLLANFAQQDRRCSDFDEILPSSLAQQASEQGVDYGMADTQNLLVPELVAVPQPPVLADPVEPERQSDNFWQRFGSALGVDLNAMDQNSREALAMSAARLLKQSIGGLQQSLRTRSELKNELRLAQSTAQHTSLNPLKYSGNAGEALGFLLQPQKPGQWPAEHAIAQGFRDIQAHQVAMLAASRAALRAALEHFSPQQLTLRFERDTQKTLFSTAGKRWRAYERYHQILLQDDDWSERLLARDFAQVYADQVRLIATLHTGN
ncbi:type VI secretion system-associated FHA domain protein TagH [Pseudomonas sp. DWP3-1-2]|uniref:type VI secretion system-associated FHA domain protein TagH n=1 Tax=Pseudomonas sp. DWP3-1-2 TaxID=2804645 RepID=UPI003CFB5737